MTTLNRVDCIKFNENALVDKKNMAMVALRMGTELKVITQSKNLLLILLSNKFEYRNEGHDTWLTI